MVKSRDELSYCCNDCEECNIYRAMVFGEKLNPETVQRWQEDAKKYWGIESLDPKQLNCLGCRYEGEDVFYVFKTCPVRGCCKKRGLGSCSLCPEWKTCKWPMVQENVGKLEEMDTKK